MNRNDIERCANEVLDFPYESSELRAASLKLKEIEVLQEISESLKSVAAILRGDKL